MNDTKRFPGATIRFVCSCALSLLGNSMAAVVLPLILLARTGDALAAGTLALVCAIPQMLVGVLGGALLDRVNRLNVSVVSDIISAASVALLPIVDMVWGLDFGWFVLLGLLGAIGDIPGMTARDTLLPAVIDHDGIDLQRFLGVNQSLESLATIIGPALAAVAIGFIGDTPALWITAALSFCAALVTLTLPRRIGRIEKDSSGAAAEGARAQSGASTAKKVFGAAASTLSEGMRVLFRSDAILRTSMLLTFGIVMVMGSFQGLVLPFYFTSIDEPANLGYVLSAMSAGLLAGSLAYTALAPKVRKRTWYVSSLAAMAIAVLALGTLPPYPIMLAAALFLGFSAGPASALLGFFAFDRIPENRRGSALGTQNALLLIAAPVAVFATSATVEGLGVQTAALILVGCWFAITAWAIFAADMRRIDD